MSFFEELKRRNVVRVGIAYAVAAWIILQLTDVVGEIMELPAWGGKLILLMVVVGFFLALILAWAFELTPEGVKREKDVDRSESITGQTGRKLDFAIIALLALGLAYFVYESRFMERDSAPLAQVQAETSAAETEATEPDETSPAAPDRSAIAVLPFANRSLNEEDAFFTEGIHDDLLTQLAKISGLKVVSRTSVMQYRDTEKPIPEIAAELGVGAILEGGIQRAGNRVRINAQLIDVSNDQHLWAETFDREMTVENIFEIQSEITQQITQAVRGELNEEERANLARVPTNSLEAYEAYLKALTFLHQTDYRQENFQSAEVWANRAVELDPSFAQAWAMLVEIHGQAVWIGYDATLKREQLALEALEKARQHGSGLAETIAAEAEYLYRIENDFPKAVELYKQAHAALPGDTNLLFRLGVAQRRTEDVKGGRESLREAMKLDPNNARPIIVLAESLINGGELEEAATLLDRAIPRFPLAQDLKALKVWLYLAQGKVEFARNYFATIPPTTSATYSLVAVDLPYIERDLPAVRETIKQPMMASVLRNRGLAGSTLMHRAWSLQLAGEVEAAAAEARQCIETISELGETFDQARAFEIADLAVCYVLAGNPELGIRAVNEAQALMPESRDLFFGSLISQRRAQVLGMAGERESALVEIERLLNSPYKLSRWNIWLDPRWDFFRDDERFNDLIRPEGVDS